MMNTLTKFVSFASVIPLGEYAWRCEGTGIAAGDAGSIK
jgi:hypothetical protein